MRIKTILILILLFGLPVPFLAHAEHSLKPDHVLLLNSYNQRMTWVKDIINAVEDVLDPGNNNIVLHIANMDSKQFHSSEYFNSYKNYLKNKYKNSKFSLILSSDNNAFDFLRKNRDELFPGVPVVFCGVNNFKDNMIKESKNFTGVAEIFSARRTVEIALTLHPETKKIFVVNDYLETGQAWTRDIKTVLSDIKKGIEINYSENLGMDELLAKIGNLDKKTLVLLGVYFADKDGKYFTYEKVGEMISGASQVPVYCLLEFNIGKGVVGGEVISGYYQGQAMAKIGKRILKGESPDHIPVLKKGTNRIIFDFLQLKRFGLTESSLPNGSVVINQPFSIFQEYKREILAILFMTTFLVITIVALVLNILRRIHAEKELRKEKDFTEMALNSQQDTFFLFERATGKAIRWNRAFNDITGYSDEEIAKMPAPDSYYSPNDLARISLFVKEILKTGIGTIELDLICRDNRKIPMEYSVSVFKDDGGKPKYFISIGRDITERRTAQKALGVSHERFLTVLNSIDATIYVADMKTHEILFLNKYMIESFGRDMTGEICYDVFRNESTPCSHCTNDQLIDEMGNPTGVCVWHGKNPITGKWYINYDRAIEWADGRLVKLQIATDVTDLKKMEEELRQAHKMESIGTLAGGIAHDFNNILGIIIGNAELALDDTPDWNPTHQNIMEIKTASLRAKDVVRQLLSFSRKTEQKQKPLDILPIIKESLKLIRASIPSNIEIRETISDTSDIILADATQIHQIIINLCTNASHAMGENGGILEIIVAHCAVVEETGGKFKDLPPGNYLELVVKDTGSGIDLKTRDKIFDPYFTTKEVGKGTGMGLAVVHGIIKNHNGYIFVNSEPGKGTSFTTFFPTVAKSPVQESKTTKKNYPHGSETILFVDDEKSIVDMTEQVLKRLGYKVETQTNPVKALETFKTNPDHFDLIISDMTMPQMNGVTLSKEIKMIRPGIPIIICTGNYSVLDKKKATTIGISSFTMKPVSMAKIAKLIRDVLDR